VEDFKTLRKRAQGTRDLEIEPQYRTLGRRIYAGIFDGAIFCVPAILIEALLLFINVDYRYQTYSFAILPFTILYPIVTTKLFGGTPGKLYFNLVVQSVTNDGRISWVQSILRETINIISSLVDSVGIYIFFIAMAKNSFALYQKFTSDSVVFQVFGFLAGTVLVVEIVTARASKKRRSVHDFIAGTVVVTTGPCRKWSTLVAIVSFGLLLAIFVWLFNYMHN
jgi:uncharacterized RDD family membrane protein YckC